MTASRNQKRKSLATLEREAVIVAYKAEAKKHRAEEEYYREAIEELRYLRMERETVDRARRVLTLSEEITDEVAWAVVETLDDWAHESQEPITLRLMQPGGDIVYGLAIYDFTRELAQRGIVVGTHTLGMAASMGSILVQCGQRRTMAPNSFMLIHEGRTRYNEDMIGYVERFTDKEDDLKFSMMLEDRCDAILAERSVLSPGELRERYARRDWWISSQEAVELGFADDIYPGER